MTIFVDRTRCAGLGVCESLAPEVFEVGDDGTVVLLTEAVPDGMQESVQQAVDGCPNEALRLDP